MGSDFEMVGWGACGAAQWGRSREEKRKQLPYLLTCPELKLCLQRGHPKFWWSPQTPSPAPLTAIPHQTRTHAHTHLFPLLRNHACKSCCRKKEIFKWGGEKGRRRREKWETEQDSGGAEKPPSDLAFSAGTCGAPKESTVIRTAGAI